MDTGKTLHYRHTHHTQPASHVSPLNLGNRGVTVPIGSSVRPFLSPSVAHAGFLQVGQARRNAPLQSQQTEPAAQRVRPPRACLCA